jgi:hypothetical protein
MAIREGMTQIVALIRQYGHVTTNDMTLGAVTYWTDEQLEAIADMHSVRITTALTPVQTVGRTLYKLATPSHYYAELSTVVMLDGSKNIVTTEYTYNLLKQEVTFTSDLDENTAYYMEGSFTYFYDAMADLWGQKARQRYDYIAFKGGDNKMEHDQEYMHCKAEERHYMNLIGRRFERKAGKKWSVS